MGGGAFVAIEPRSRSRPFEIIGALTVAWWVAVAFVGFAFDHAGC